MVTYLVLLLLLGIPVAVAGQNVVTGLFLLLSLWAMFQDRPRAREQWREFWRIYRVPFSLSILLVALLALATALNPRSPTGIQGALELIPGHFGWLMVPPFIYILAPRMTPYDWRRVVHWLTLIVVAMATLAWTQVIWGWRIEDNAIVADVKRAQVFYSHPLTLAYVALLLFPAGFLSLLRSPRSPWALALCLSSGSLILTSGSRTAQAVCILFIMINLFLKLTGRLRVTLLGLSLALLLGVGLTPNPMSRRFREVITREDTRSDYPDDRLAFWHAHWLMFQEKPILGHGDHLNTAYRQPYYARIGLVDFIRTYEAHNMFIQIAVNTGILGLSVFLAWWLWHLRYAWQLASKSRDGEMIFQTLVVWLVASLTQNSFQDSEPRYALTLLIASLYIYGRYRPNAPSSAFSVGSTVRISATV